MKGRVSGLTVKKDSRPGHLLVGHSTTPLAGSTWLTQQCQRDSNCSGVGMSVSGWPSVARL